MHVLITADWWELSEATAWRENCAKRDVEILRYCFMKSTFPEGQVTSLKSFFRDDNDADRFGGKKCAKFRLDVKSFSVLSHSFEVYRETMA